MRLINTKLHGWIDYVFALVLIALPWLAGYHWQSIPAQVCFGNAAAIIVYSLFTNYEMGVLGLRGIPFAWHLVLDILSGLFFAAAPWIFHFHDISYLPFVILGLSEVLIALTTDTVAYARLGPERMRP